MKYRHFNSMSFNIENRINDFQNILGFSFNNIELLKQALTHRSYDHKNSNERLEFLGDAILSYVISEKLYKLHTNMSEGELTQMRAALVSRETLYDISKNIHLDKYMIMGEGTPVTSSIISCAYEAIIGAIYIDSGIDKVNEFIDNTLLTYRSLNDEITKDYKSQLQQKIIKEMHIYPEYIMTHEEGPDHDKRYTMAVYINKQIFGQGSGKSKKEAEQNAAKEALDKLQIQENKPNKE